MTFHLSFARECKIGSSLLYDKSIKKKKKSLYCLRISISVMSVAQDKSFQIKWKIIKGLNIPSFLIAPVDPSVVVPEMIEHLLRPFRPSPNKILITTTKSDIWGKKNQNKKKNQQERNKIYRTFLSFTDNSPSLNCCSRWCNSFKPKPVRSLPNSRLHNQNKKYIEFALFEKSINKKPN